MTVSRNMRPEVRRWGSVAGVFVTADTAVDLLGTVSRTGPAIRMEYADEVCQDVYRVRWEDGIGILRRFEALTSEAMTSAILAVNKERPDCVEALTDALGFLSNLRASAAAWEPCLDPEDGSFELLIDA